MSIIRYALSDSAVVFNNQVNEIRIRKGVWNYEEAILSLEAESEAVKDLVFAAFSDLDAGKAVDFDEYMQKYSISSAEKEGILSMVTGLKEQCYIVDAERSNTTQLLHDLINGTYEAVGLQNDVYLNPILFFSDNVIIKKEAARLCESVSLPIHILTDEEYSVILNSDVVTRFDGCTTKNDLAKICDIIAPYCCIVGGVGKLNVSFMRSLNRALIELSKPLSMALLDGPFTSVFTIKPPETGCFECMEQRIFARIQDHPVYRRFIDSTRSKKINNNAVYYTPLLSSAVSTAIFEGLTISAIGKSKFAGRALNTYVPVMELQVEDILRVPYCPACGTIAKAQIDEMYTSSKKLVDTILEKIELI